MQDIFIVMIDGLKMFFSLVGVSHLCMSKCHEGPCKPCDKILPISCRCNGTKKVLIELFKLCLINFFISKTLRWNTKLQRNVLEI